MEKLIWLTVIAAAALQIVMIIKFFTMSSDIKELKSFIMNNRMYNNTTPSENRTNENVVEPSRKDENSKTLKVYLITSIIVIVCLVIMHYTYVNFGFTLLP